MNYYYGKSVDAAIDEGLKDLGITKDEARIVVIEEATKGGVLGLGAKKAKVLVEKKCDGTKRTVEFLEGLFDMLNIPTTMEVKEGDDKVEIELISTGSSQLIGHRGEMLDALQTLSGAVLNIGSDDYKRVVLNCENYREKREETLKNLALHLADKAIRTCRKVSLEPMNPFERRIIHSALTNVEHVTTESQGVEPNRYIVIIPDEIKSNVEDKPSRRGRDNRPKKSGFTSEMIKSTKKTSGFGTYLGNSLKND